MYAGVDSHKDTLAVAVIDAGGRVVSVRQPHDFTIAGEGAFVADPDVEPRWPCRPLREASRNIVAETRDAVAAVLPVLLAIPAPDPDMATAMLAVIAAVGGSGIDVPMAVADHLGRLSSAGFHYDVVRPLIKALLQGEVPPAPVLEQVVRVTSQAGWGYEAPWEPDAPTADDARRLVFELAIRA